MAKCGQGINLIPLLFSIFKLGWSDCLRWELAPFGINVAIVEPGAIETGFADVLNQPLLDRTKGTVYEKSGHAIATASGPTSPPSVITKCVVKAVEAKHPKTRYLDGSLAKPLVFMRTWFGDRFFDAFLGMAVPRE